MKVGRARPWLGMHPRDEILPSGAEIAGQRGTSVGRTLKSPVSMRVCG